MSVSTFAELQAAINEWLHRNDLTASSDTFIALAEERFNRTLRLNAFSAVQQISIGVGQDSVALPADFQEVRLVTNGRDRWRQVTPEQMSEMTALQCQEKAYAIYGEELHIPYEASDDVDLVISYWTRIPALSNSNTSNWLLEKYPSAYLWAALSEAAIYAVKPQQGAVYENRSTQSLAEIKAAEKANEYGDVLLMVRTA